MSDRHDATRVEAYADDYSWANCSTTASRLAPESLFPTYAERCSVIVDASVTVTDAIADLVAGWKALICEDGTKEGLRQSPDSAGPWIADWSPPEGSVCYEAVMLNAAPSKAP